MQSRFVLKTIFLFSLNIISAIDTCDRITQHGYPCQTHRLTTTDGYILTVFRIPYSHRGKTRNNVTTASRPPVLLMNCVQCSSDIWVLLGPHNGLPFMLANFGYDVWLANARGNVYSEKHIKFEPSSTAFWEFSLDEIGNIDVPATIDYILAATNSQSLHYVGFSMGVTAFVMALASHPSYNQKIRTSHLLAPVVFFCHARGPLPTLGVPLLGNNNPLSVRLGTLPLHQLVFLFREVASRICLLPDYQSVCIQLLNFFVGWDSPYLNRNLLPEILATTPAGGSIRQYHHYLQLAASCGFRAFDFGLERNLQKYGKPKPPAYNLTNVHPKTPMEMYFSDNDFLADTQDLYRLSEIFGKRASWNRVKYMKYNHFDFALAYNLKECIYDCVVHRMQRYEGRDFNLDLCKCFRNKPF
uniref:Lipase n=1 Tax=Stomoxys calcitrans TaxID=35570 RepID=A0A1I8NU82_STOCA